MNKDESQMPTISDENRPPTDKNGRKEKAVPTQSKNIQPTAQTDKKEDKPYWWFLLSNKKIVAGVIGAFFLFYFTGVVPVGKIPLLRSLVQMMGYSQEETQSISFLGALFSWKDSAKRAQGELEREISSQRNAEAHAGDSNRHLNSLTSSSLFDLQKVNSSLRAQGQGADIVRNVSGGPAEDESASPIPVSANAQAGTQANSIAEVSNDVFFGAEANTGVPRNKQDGYDSVKTLAKIANPYQIKGSRSDWMADVADKAFWADAGVQALLNEVEKGSGGGRIARGLLRDIGNSKSQRDIYYAYLTSRAGTRTNNLWLQKTLAAASFMGADLDRKMLSFSSYGGITLDKDAMVTDMENIELRIEMEQRCKESLKNGGDDLMKNMGTIVSQVKSEDLQFPSTCAESDIKGGEIRSFVQKAKVACEEVKESYTHLKDSCGIVAREGNCTQADFLVTEKIDVFGQKCEDELKTCQEAEAAKEDGGDPSKCDAEIAEKTFEELVGDSPSDLKKSLEGIIVPSSNGTDASPYFSMPDWQSTLNNQELGVN